MFAYSHTMVQQQLTCVFHSESIQLGPGSVSDTKWNFLHLFLTTNIPFLQSFQIKSSQFY